jgi:thiamine biosynthesis lipoprotein
VIVASGSKGRTRRARSDSAAQGNSQPECAPIVPVSHTTTAMGGRLAVHLDAGDRADEARLTGPRLAARIERWAARITRHAEASDLIRLNSDPATEVAVGPTLAAALRAGIFASEASEGFADITLLDARLAAEGIGEGAGASRFGEWQLLPGRRGAAVVMRPAALRFDLGGVGKGWIADRALGLLDSWPGALVDADGDLVMRCAPGECWEIGIEDPRTGLNMAVLRLAAPRGGVPVRWGVATSGVSVHRWAVGGVATHHLIDPRTGHPAETDIVQATVVAASALRAEALAKAAVIAGSVEGFALLDRAHVRGAILLTTGGNVQALPSTLPLLAA